MSPWKRILAISGPDGSGKSVIIEGLAKRMASGGRRVDVVWLRYNHYLTRYVLALARLLGLTAYHNHHGTRIGYHHFERARWLAILFVMTTWLDTFLVTLFKVYLPVILRGHTIICDRWVVDILVDLELDTGIPFESDPFLRSLFSSLAPSGATYVILERDTRAIKSVRPENRVDARLPRRLQLYRRYAQHRRYVRIQNSGTIQEAVTRIEQLTTGPI